MRTTRAFLASVPLAIVLVAALVVPLAVIPGTFGFQSWPTSVGNGVTENQVQVAPPTRTRVAHGQPHAGAGGRRNLASLPPASNRAHAAPAHVAGPTPATGHAPRGHRAPAVAHTPSSHNPSRPHHHAPSAPSAPSTPTAPQQPPTAPLPGPDSVASDEPPIAREDPAANPVVPPPAPVQEVVPQEPPRPAAPLPSPPSGDEGDCHGHGHGRGLALGHGQGNGNGHGNGHADD